MIRVPFAQVKTPHNRGAIVRAPLVVYRTTKAAVDPGAVPSREPKKAKEPKGGRDTESSAFWVGKLQINPVFWIRSV